MVCGIVVNTVVVTQIAVVDVVPVPALVRIADNTSVVGDRTQIHAVRGKIVIVILVKRNAVFRCRIRLTLDIGVMEHGIPPVLWIFLKGTTLDGKLQRSTWKFYDKILANGCIPAVFLLQ